MLIAGRQVSRKERPMAGSATVTRVRGECPASPRKTSARTPEVTLEADTGAATSVDKALAVLEAFRGPGTVLGVTEVARRGELPKSTAHRMLNLLVDRGYVNRVGNRYMLSSMLFELGNSVSHSRPRALRSVAMPYMIDLLQSLNATVHLTTFAEGDLLFLEKVYGHFGVRNLPPVGSRVAADGTAPGDVMRAFSSTKRSLPAFVGYDDVPRFERIRDRGIAYQGEPGDRGGLSVSAPIFVRSKDAALAALTIALQKNQHRKPGLENELREAAAAISANT